MKRLVKGGVTLGYVEPHDNYYSVGSTLPAAAAGVFVGWWWAVSTAGADGYPPGGRAIGLARTEDGALEMLRERWRHCGSADAVVVDPLRTCERCGEALGTEPYSLLTRASDGKPVGALHARCFAK